MTNEGPQFGWFRVGRPIKRVKLNFEPSTPLEEPVNDGPLIRAGRPLERVNLKFDAVVWVYMELTLTLQPETDKTVVTAVFEKLNALVDLLNAYEAELGGSGVSVDASKSGVRPGPTIGLVLIPNNTNGAERRLVKLAEILAKTVSEYPSKAEVTARVFSTADLVQPLFFIAV